jgi:predicted Zn-dependent peptidase
VTGDFEKADMLALLRRLSAVGQGQRARRHDSRCVETDAKTGLVRFVNKDTSQTHLRVGHLTIKETDPDYVAVAIANDILGGSSFRSRLFNDVHETRPGLFRRQRSAGQCTMKASG